MSPWTLKVGARKLCLNKFNSEVKDMQPEVSEPNMEDYQGEIPVAVLDELIAMKTALQLSGPELAA